MKVVRSTPPPPAFPLDLIRPEMEKVEHTIQAQAKAFDPGVEGYVAYVCNSSGKRIRPALALLMGGATGGIKEEHRLLSTVLELVHIASLVHDDIMDGAELRRDLPTPSAKWGSSLSVLLGDSLFAYALELATNFDDASICRRIARATRDVCSGEILQTQRRYDFNLALPDYFRMIEMKTAALFAAATELAAAVNDQDETVVAAMRDFGMKLGAAYQIYDDCLDLVGDEKTAGKTLGTDLAKGKLTLPMLNLLSSATEAQREKLRRRLLKGEPMDTTILAGIADYEGAIEQSLMTAKGMLNTARGHLDLLIDSAHRDALFTMIGFMEGLLDKCRSSGA